MHSFFHSPDGRISIFLFFIACSGFVYFKHSVHDANAANRVALCLAILDDRSTIIDRYYHFSSDHCLRNGHYYCDKAPGASFPAIPFVAVAYYGQQAMGTTDFTSFDPTEIKEEACVPFKLLLLAASVAVSILCAVGVSLFYLLGRLFGVPPKRSTLGALLFAFGTPYGVWATIMIGHSLAAAFLLAALVLGLGIARREATADGNEGRLFFQPRWMVVGFLLAYSVWVEYTAAVPACLLGAALTAAWCKGRFRFDNAVRTALPLFLGAVPVALGFCYYNSICFGGPLKVGYQSVGTNFPMMDEGFFGLSLPKPRTLLCTLADPHCGILWYYPLFLLSPFWAMRNVIAGRERVLNLLCLMIPLYYYLLNASYAYWFQSDIPMRHATGAMPFLLIPFFFGWNRSGFCLRLAAAVCATANMVFGLTAVMVPCLDSFYEAKYRSFHLLCQLFSGGVRNLAAYAGVDPFLSLLPIVTVWSVFGFLIHRELKTDTNVP